MRQPAANAGKRTFNDQTLEVLRLFAPAAFFYPLIRCELFLPTYMNVMDPSEPTFASCR